MKEESAAVWTDAPAPFGEGVERTVAHERDATGTAGLDGLVLRYGFFYGPSTWYSRDGSGAARIRRRRFPIVGRGEGIFSFIHVDDAAAATVAACERGDPGIYNVVDDEPAPVREWLPVLARELGAKRPLRAPAWLARIVAGPFATALARDLRGASNAKAKRELGFEPLYPSWRQGFAEGLG